MVEEWKPVEGYEGRYEVSNTGKVRTVERIIMRSNGKPTSIKQMQIKPFHSNGYLMVRLRSDGDRKHNHKVHRLVATAFIPNPENKPCVDHIDHNRENARVTNLRWVTYLENNKNK